MTAVSSKSNRKSNSLVPQLSNQFDNPAMGNKRRQQGYYSAYVNRAAAIQFSEESKRLLCN